MSEAIKIDKGVPIPPRRSCVESVKHKLIKSMEKGDSFVVSDFKTSRQYHTTFKRLGMKCSMRILPDKQVRIWRIE